MYVYNIYIDEKTSRTFHFAPKMTLPITLLFESNAYLILLKKNYNILILCSVSNSVNNIEGKKLI